MLQARVRLAALQSAEPAQGDRRRIFFIQGHVCHGAKIPSCRVGFEDPFTVKDQETADAAVNQDDLNPAIL